MRLIPVLMLVLISMLELGAVTLPLPATCWPRVTGRLGTTAHATAHATAMTARMRAADNSQSQCANENQFVHDVFPF